MLPINILLMVFLSSVPESEAERGSGDSAIPIQVCLRWIGSCPPSQLISCGGEFGQLWEVSFPAPWAACGLTGRVHKRKDILLILVINPLVISEMRAKTARKAQDATASISPSLHNQPLVSPNFPYYFFFNKK